MPNKISAIKQVITPKTPVILWVVCLLCLAMVSTSLVIKTAWHDPFVWLFLPSQSLSLNQMVVQLQLIPTMFVAMLSGGLLGVASVLLQQLVKNNLASDTTLAVGSGAELSLLIVAIVAPSFGLHGSFWVAFFGSLLGMVLVFAISTKSHMNSVILILSGLVVNILFFSIAQLLIIFYPDWTMGVLVWGSGYLTQSSWQTGQFLLAISVFLPPVLFLLLKPLTLMGLDDRQAKSLGVPVAQVRLAAIILVAIITASVVSRVGILSFVGLASASMVNLLAIRHLWQRLLAGFGFGAVFLWLSNNLVTLLTTWLKPMIQLNLPVGALTGILGSGMVIWLVIHQSKQHIHHEESFAFLTIKRSEKTRFFWFVMALILAIMGGLALYIAPNAMGHLTIQTDVYLIEQFRLPRTLSAMATGTMLACAGVLLQKLTCNPMASPEVMGISSGGALGVILAFLFNPLLLAMLGLENQKNADTTVLLVSGMIGSGLVLLLVIWLARKLSPSLLLLVGVAISAMMTSVLTLIKISGDPRLQAILNWLSGTTYYANPNSAWWVVIAALVLFIISLFILKPLQIMSLNETMARHLGVSIKLTKIITLILVALLSTISTLVVGPLSFIGLMTPHLAMTLGAVRLSQQLALSAMLGAGLMLIADWIGRYVIFPYEIPAGIIASVIGGTYLLYLMKMMPKE